LSYEQKLNTGSLFANRDHAKNPKAPNAKGTALVQVGNQFVELELAAWTRESDKAGKWQSLSLKVKSVRPAPPPHQDMDRAFGKPGKTPAWTLSENGVEWFDLCDHVVINAANPDQADGAYCDDQAHSESAILDYTDGTQLLAFLAPASLL